MKKVWYEVQSLHFISPTFKRRISARDMQQFAIQMLKTNKRLGLDKDVRVKDLQRPDMAWSYLKSIGLGYKTNMKL